jgi:hypothetical protein
MTKKVYYFVYTLLEYASFTCLLFHFIRDAKFRRIMLGGSALFTIFIVINFYVTSYKRMDSVPIGVSTILLFIYIFYYLFNSLKEIESKSMYKGPELWFVTGILAYLGSTFFFNILANSVDSDFMKNYWHLSFFGDILKNLLFAIGAMYYIKATRKAKIDNSSIDYLLGI